MNTFNSLSRILVVAALLPSMPLSADGNDRGGRRAFVACPVVRDTASVPCWLASDGGVTYFLGIQVDISAPFHPPQLKHRVLVEGTISDEPKICGGVVLKPVTVSVLPELDYACNTMLPKEDRFTVVDPPRGPGPSNRGKRVATQNAAAPAVGSVPVAETGARETGARETGEGPMTFSVPFDFDGLYMNVHAFPAVMHAAAYAKQLRAGHVVVIGHRGMVILSNGELLYEDQELAERRARKVAQAMKEFDVDPTRIDIEWQAVADHAEAPAHGRRVDITISLRSDDRAH